MAELKHRIAIEIKSAPSTKTRFMERKRVLTSYSFKCGMLLNSFFRLNIIQIEVNAIFCNKIPQVLAQINSWFSNTRTINNNQQQENNTST